MDDVMNPAAVAQLVERLEVDDRPASSCAQAQTSMSVLRNLGCAISEEAHGLHHSKWAPGIGAGFDEVGQWRRQYPAPEHKFIRRNDWHFRLAALINDRRQSLWVAGVHDCVNWIRLSVEAVTGAKIALTFEKEGKTIPAMTMPDALTMFDQAGGHMSDFWSTKLGAPQPPERARPGDVGLMLMDSFTPGRQYSAGVLVWGDDQIIAVGQFELATLPRSCLKLCWPIG